MATEKLQHVSYPRPDQSLGAGTEARSGHEPVHRVSPEFEEILPLWEVLVVTLPDEALPKAPDRITAGKDTCNAPDTMLCVCKKLSTTLTGLASSCIPSA